MFCNTCGQVVSDNASTCMSCGVPLPQLPKASPSSLSTEDKKVRLWAIAITVFGACFGIAWDLLFGALLFFHTYSFFEGVVVCLLVMILCTVFTTRADFELWSQVFHHSKDKTDKAVDHEALDQLRAHLKALFYAIAFLMAVIKLVMILIES